MDKKSTLFHVYLVEYRYHAKEMKKDFLNGAMYDYHRQGIREVKDKMRNLLKGDPNDDRRA